MLTIQTNKKPITLSGSSSVSTVVRMKRRINNQKKSHQSRDEQKIPRSFELRKKVPIVINSVDGKKKLKLRVRSSTSLAKAFNLFAVKLGYPKGVLRFTHQGFTVPASVSVASVASTSQRLVEKHRVYSDSDCQVDPIRVVFTAMVYHN